MKANQIHLVALAMSCGSNQVVHALESRFLGQIVRDVRLRDRRNRIHDDMAVVHAVAAAHLDMRVRPDADRTSDSPAPDSLSQASGEQHLATGFLEDVAKLGIQTSEFRIQEQIPNS
jgi:hypothetical protein